MTTNKTRIYISYARESAPHDEWVKDFASKLRAFGVEPILDDWHFAGRPDAERAALLSAKNADMVFAICTPEYKHRAMNGIGGVGREFPLLRLRHNPFWPPSNSVYFILKTGDRQESIPEEATPYVFDFTKPEHESIEFSKLLNLLPGKIVIMDKSRIQTLVASGRTDEALALMSLNREDDAVLLHARFANAKKQYNIGLIDFTEWQRIQNQVNFALLDMASTDSTNANPQPGTAPSEAQQSVAEANTPQVFISYNHHDSHSAQLVRAFLEQNGVKVLIDSDMAAGQFIDDFIDDSLTNANFLLPIISPNSLMSGWVSKEITIGFLAERITSKKVVPVCLDMSVLKHEFFFEAVTKIDQEIGAAKDNLVKALALTGDIRAFQDKLGRLNDLKNNFGSFFAHLQNVKVTDIAGEHFEAGMKKVLKVIKPN